MSISIPIVAFLFVCIIYPHLVKNKSQFYMAFAVLILILLLEVVEDVVNGSAGFMRFLRVTHDILYIVDLVLFVLASGGLSLHELKGEFQNAFEVMRRGETKPTLIIPKRDNPYAQAPPPPVQPASMKEEGDRSIPLE